MFANSIVQVKVATCAVKVVDCAPAVVEAARRHGASLLVLGQRRRRAATRWLQKLRRKPRGRGGAMVEYCIEHAPCLALGARQRSSGGYLVSVNATLTFFFFFLFFFLGESSVSLY